MTIHVPEDSWGDLAPYLAQFSESTSRRDAVEWALADLLHEKYDVMETAAHGVAGLIVSEYQHQPVTGPTTAQMIAAAVAKCAEHGFVGSAHNHPTEANQ